MSSAKEPNQDNLLLGDISVGGGLHLEETIEHIVEDRTQDPPLLITEGGNTHPKEIGNIEIGITRKAEDVIARDLARRNTEREDKADLIHKENEPDLYNR